MGKHKVLSLDTHKYKTTFTSTTKIVHRFSNELCVKNQVEFMVQLVGTNHVNPCSQVVANLVSKQDPKIARV